MRILIAKQPDQVLYRRHAPQLRALFPQYTHVFSDLITSVPYETLDRTIRYAYRLRDFPYGTAFDIKHDDDHPFIIRDPFLDPPDLFLSYSWIQISIADVDALGIFFQCFDRDIRTIFYLRH